MKIEFKYTVFYFLSFCYCAASAQNKNAGTVENWKVEAIQNIQAKYSIYKSIALQIWDYAEVGYKEEKSSALLQKTLKGNGFEIKTGVAGIPTAFVASYGSGKPVIGVLAEFDALPGLAQGAVPEKKSIEGKNAGHACGHHLFGTASVAAGIEIKKMLEQKSSRALLGCMDVPQKKVVQEKFLWYGKDCLMMWRRSFIGIPMMKTKLL